MILEYFKDGYHYKFSNDELNLTCPDGSTNPFAFVDNKATIASSEYNCNKISYISKNSLDELTINLKSKNIEIRTNSDKALKAGVQKAFEQNIISPESITLNSHTYNIKSLSNLEIRNAIDNIPKVSFLLSNILIRAGEEIDLGSRGIYKVKSGDTLSTIDLRIKRNLDETLFIDETHKYSDDEYVPDWKFMKNYIKSLHYKELTTKNKVGLALNLDIEK